MNTQNQYKLRSKAVNLKPVVWIGKGGLNSDVFDEISRQLDKKELIKVKLTKSFISERNKKQVAEEIILKTKSKLISFVGFIIILYKEKNRK
jgi:RNA-binding protein